MAPSFLAFFSKRENPKTLRKYSDPPPKPRTTTPAALPPNSAINTSTSPSIGGISEQIEGSQLSLETEYILADPDSPTKSSSIYPLGSAPSHATASTTKIRMPFRKKKSTSTEVLPPSVQSIAPPRSMPKEPQKSSVESSLSDSPSLRPPPSRSAIFGSYADPHNAMSTRSLPQDVPFAQSGQSSPRNYETMSNPDSHVTSPTALSYDQSSKGGMFAWARPRPRTKSKASVPDSSIRSSPAPLPADSFNLKSFRHVTPSASQSPNPDLASSSRPPHQSATSRSRTRDNSFASDSSQRIPVAAFREVQARRSAAGSPVPSLPGDRDTFVSGQVRARRPSSALGTPPPLPTSEPQTPLSASRSPPTRSSTASLYIPNSMTSSESSDGDESESEKGDTLRPNRQRTATNRATRSELGHRSPPIFSAARSDVGHGTPSGSPGLVSSSSRSVSYSPNTDIPGRASRDSSVYSRSRASVSTSALVPDAAAKPVSMTSKHSIASRPIQSSRAISRASTPSESSSSSSSSEDLPLSSRMAVSRAPDSPARRPKPLIDIGELVSGNMTLPMRTSEPLKDSPDVVKEADSPTGRSRKASLGIGERLSALASGFNSPQPSRTKSPGSPSDSRDEVFTPPEVPKMPRSPSPIIPSPLSPPVSPIRPPPRALGRRVGKPAIRLKPSEGPKVDTSSLDLDSGITPPPSSSTSSDTPIPFTKPRPIRERQEPPAFTVTSRPTSHASSPSASTLAALDKAIADASEAQGSGRAVASMPDQVKEDPERQPQQSQPGSPTTVRVVRGVPSKPSREDPLPVLRPQHRPRVLSTGVTVSNIRVTSTPLSTSPPTSAAPRRGPGSGPAAPPRKPFALRDSSPASSAGDSNSSRMPPTPRDGSELGTTSTGRPGIGHRKRASVTFADSVEDDEEKVRRRSISVGSRPSRGHGHTVASSSSDDEATAQDREREAEEKRKTRRRNEAKAAIELGKVINGHGPIDDDDDDDEEEQPLNVPPRMSMGMGTGMGIDMNPNHNIPFPTAVGPMGSQGQWGASSVAAFGNQLNNVTLRNLLNSGPGANLTNGMDMGTGMNMNMGMGMVDPRVFAAHQQAMLIAKQTYQLAVAHQAMRNAADEWERGSAMSGWGGGSSSVGTSSVLGMNMNMNMNMGGLGAGGFPGGGMGWSNGGMSGLADGSGRPMFAGGMGGMYAASEVGGGSDRGGAVGWATNSVYGESFGAPRDRSRGVRQNQVSSMSSSGGSAASAQAVAGRREGGRPRTKTAPSSGSGQRVNNNAGVKKRVEGYGLVGAVSPPSSWKGPS